LCLGIRISIIGGEMPCKSCGMCCQCIILMYGKNEMLRNARQNKSSDAAFMFKFWKEISKKQAMAINPRYVKIADKGILLYNAKGQPVDKSVRHHYFTCLKYNARSKTCRVHNYKPRVCSQYPWYGKPPRADFIFFSEDCGYKDDYVHYIDNRVIVIKEGIDGTESSPKING